MRRFRVVLASLAAIVAAAPAVATIVPPGTKLIAFTPFLTATQGTLLASKVISGQSFTRDAIMRDGKLEAGVDLLPKPFTYTMLANKLRDVLDRVDADAE